MPGEGEQGPGPIRRVAHVDEYGSPGGLVTVACGRVWPLRWAYSFVTWEWSQVTCEECRRTEPADVGMAA